MKNSESIEQSKEKREELRVKIDVKTQNATPEFVNRASLPKASFNLENVMSSTNVTLAQKRSNEQLARTLVKNVIAKVLENKNVEDSLTLPRTFARNAINAALDKYKEQHESSEPKFIAKRIISNSLRKYNENSSEPKAVAQRVIAKCLSKYNSEKSQDSEKNSNSSSETQKPINNTPNAVAKRAIASALVKYHQKHDPEKANNQTFIKEPVALTKEDKELVKNVVGNSIHNTLEKMYGVNKQHRLINSASDPQIHKKHATFQLPADIKGDGKDNIIENNTI